MNALVNGEHLRAFFWLRWRLRINQLKRGGTANAILLVFLAVGAVLLALLLFVGALLIGLYALEDAPAWAIVLTWDGLVLLFLFLWLIGIVTDLQRSEALSLSKFLHLPVSVAGAFFINYLSSLFSLSLLLFVPAMVGLTIALVLTKGPAMLLVLPLLAAFLFVVTALTYQFQGWLAALMTNPRRRRTVIVVVTAAFVLIAQAPNIIVNIFKPWKNSGPNDSMVQSAKEASDLKRSRDAGEITEAQFLERHKQLAADQSEILERQRQSTLASIEETTRIFNILLPPGWLPLGAGDLANGSPWAALLGMLGLGLIGAGSLRRGYRTSLRLYTGQYTAGTPRPSAPQPPPAAKPSTPPNAAPPKETPNPLEKDLPWLSEPAAAVALGSFRSLLRAPEAKMMLLSPVLLLLVFGSMFFTRSSELPEGVWPLLPFGVMAMVLLSMMQVVGNQFGFDREGFRIYVLAPAPRRDILLGKNLAIAPLALGMGVIGAVVLQLIYPLYLDHFLAVPLQFLSMFIIFCMLMNCLSLLAPLHLPAGSFRPKQIKAIAVLLHLAFLIAVPLLLSLALLPLGLEMLCQQQGWSADLPLCLLLSLLECVGLVFLYRLVLGWQGAWLQAREQRILEIVTAKAE